MRVRVDRQKCQGHNRCYLTCPEVYKIDEDGYSYLERAEVPIGIEEKARRGAEVCPENAIIVTR